MTPILIGCAAVIVLASALYVLLARPDLVAACWYRMFHDPDPYDGCFATVPDDVPPRDPVDEHFTSASRVVYVKSDHPEDCAKKCCWEIRLTEMHDRFDWHAYEYEMGKTK